MSSFSVILEEHLFCNCQEREGGLSLDSCRYLGSFSFVNQFNVKFVKNLFSLFSASILLI